MCEPADAFFDQRLPALPIIGVEEDWLTTITPQYDVIKTTA
jgi:hypothetical protein